MSIHTTSSVEDAINPVEQQTSIKEEPKDEDYFCGGTSSTSVDHNDEIQKPSKEEEVQEEYLYCELCKSFFINKCEVHGPALFIPDTPVPMGVLGRARQTLPPGLEIRKSGIPHTGLGVFNTGETVPVGAHFGPYEENLLDKGEAMNSGDSWVMNQSKQREEYIDATTERNSNWMRYVSCARNDEEQNLVAFRHRGRILYRCRRPIQAGQELLVWYLGVTYEQIWNTSKNEMNSTQVFLCSLCPLSYTVEIYLHKHIKRCHDEEYSRLLKSGLVKYDNLLPVRKTAGEKRRRRKIHQCSECGKNFSNPSHLELHRYVHTGEKPHRCSHCDKSFGRPDSLKRHQRIHTGEKPYQCSHCRKSFAYESNLKEHERLHGGDKPYECGICGKSFCDRHDFRRHQRIHTGEKPYRCSHCGRSFGRLNTLKQHQRLHTGEKPYRCSQCGRSFTQRNSLQLHQRVHTGEKPYRCAHCGRSFTQQMNYERHQRVHTGEKPFRCLQCGKRFTQQINLQRHHRVHTGEKPYGCSQCGKSFTQHYILKQHQSIHTGQRPYRCSQCDKSFTHRSTLKQHCRVHTGEKSYCCSECGKSFGHQGSLQGHRRVHSGEKPYLCSECGKGFTQQHSLKRHQRVHTGAVPIHHS